MVTVVIITKIVKYIIPIPGTPLLGAPIPPKPLDFSANITNIIRYNAISIGRFGNEDCLRCRRSGPVYQSFVFRDGKLAGVVMVDDKPRAQLYKQAVLSRHDNTLVDQGLSL